MAGKSIFMNRRTLFIGGLAALAGAVGVYVVMGARSIVALFSNPEDVAGLGRKLEDERALPDLMQRFVPSGEFKAADAKQEITNAAKADIAENRVARAGNWFLPQSEAELARIVALSKEGDQ